MDTVEVSGRLITALITFSLYLAAAGFCYWQLAPRLTANAARIALLITLSHLAIMVAHFARSDAWRFGQWLFGLNGEFNVASMVTAITGISVCAIMLRTAHLRYTLGLGRWLYYLVMALFFLLLTWEEYGKVVLDGQLPIIGLLSYKNVYYIAGGTALAATVYSALTGERDTLLWHLVMIVALLLLGTFVIIVDAMGNFCGTIFGAWISGCVQKYVIEESAENFAIWLALVAALGHLGTLAAANATRIGKLLILTSLLWFALVMPTSHIVPHYGRENTRPANVAYASGQYLHAFYLEQLADKVSVDLFLSPAQLGFENLGYSVHLIDQETGESIASRSGDVDHRGRFFLAPGWRPGYRRGASIPLPADARRNRIIWVALSLWSKEGDEYVDKTVSTSELAQLSDSTVILGEIVIPSDPLGAPEQPALALFDNGFALRPVEIAEEAVAGDNLRITFRWHSAMASRETYIQFLHFFHDDTGSFWVYDQHPLGLRLPTRRWWPGLEDEETWDIPLPDDLTAGRYSVFTGLYRIDDKQRLPVSAADGSEFVDHRIPLGDILILD